MFFASVERRATRRATSVFVYFFSTFLHRRKSNKCAPPAALQQNSLFFGLRAHDSATVFHGFHETRVKPNAKIHTPKIMIRASIHAMTKRPKRTPGPKKDEPTAKPTRARQDSANNVIDFCPDLEGAPAKASETAARDADSGCASPPRPKMPRNRPAHCISCQHYSPDPPCSAFSGGVRSKSRQSTPCMSRWRRRRCWSC